MSDLELTLAWLGMDRYLESFIEAGFDSWDTVLEITESDLNVSGTNLPLQGFSLIISRPSMWIYGIGESYNERLPNPNNKLGTQ